MSITMDQNTMQAIGMICAAAVLIVITWRAL